jgi:cytochrome c oxidase subunit II
MPSSFRGWRRCAARRGSATSAIAKWFDAHRAARLVGWTELGFASIQRSGGVALALGVVFLAACGVDQYPNTTFAPHTEFGREIDHIWNILLYFGTGVFILVEFLLVYAIIRFRHREGGPEPQHVHGNTALEITWTAIPAVILALIAVPTVRTIFSTQAKAEASALQVEVYGHQWWWEFRYPQYNVVTANELYLPNGRKVNFALRTADVLHSFWIPQLGGKRDVISNHTNYLWFTPDSNLGEQEWNGSCNEYCGASHAEMRFRVYTVPPADFESWAKHQALPAVYPSANTAAPSATASQTAPTVRTVADVSGQPAQRAAPASDEGYVFPKEKLPPHAIPQTPLPKEETFEMSLKGDAATGLKTYSSQACIGCHTIKGNPASVGVVGPNLTHVASRYTIAAALYPNDTEHLRYWVKNTHMDKPAVLMPVLGKGQIDPETGKVSPLGTLTDQQIADIVAYLQELK